MSLNVFADMLFIEAESGKADGIATVNNSGAYNGKAIQSKETEQTIEYKFNIEKAGKYIIWARVYATASSDNSYLYSFNGSKNGSDLWIFDFYEENDNPTPGSSDPYFDPKVQGPELYSTWYWIRMNYRDVSTDPAGWYNTQIFDMSTGTQTLLLQTREVGAMIDKFIITDDLNYNPNKIDGDPEVPYLAELAAAAAAAAAAEAAAAAPSAAVEEVQVPVAVAAPAPVPNTSDNGSVYVLMLLSALLTAGVLILRRRKCR